MPLNIDQFNKIDKYLVFSGIGNHGTFVSMIKNYGLNILKDIEFPDHYNYTVDDIDQILKEIFEHQARLDLTCRFNWTENAVAIWDNRSVIHYAIADFFPGRGLGYERIMDRIAIEGDHPQ